jgi:hypothetical protein
MGDDEEGCSNSVASNSYDLTVLNINDPPFLEQDVPDVDYFAGETVFAYSLNDFFADPDLDSLTYSVSGNSLISINIDSNSLVSISSSQCGIREVVIFSAFDTYNETAGSNAVTITCTNTTNPVVSSSRGTSNGGSGGSGVSSTTGAT